MISGSDRLSGMGIPIPSAIVLQANMAPASYGIAAKIVIELLLQDELPEDVRRRLEAEARNDERRWRAATEELSSGPARAELVALAEAASELAAALARESTP